MNSTDIKRKIRLKCRFESDIRSVYITEEMDFTSLRRRLSSDFGFEVSMKYQDKEGDLITLASQNDLDALFQSGVDSVNVTITEFSFPMLASQNTRILNTPTSITSGNTLPPHPMSTPGERKSSSQFNSAARLSMSGASISSSAQQGVHLFPSIFDQSGDIAFQERSNIRWKKSDIIGQGAFGVVSFGLNIDTGELMAVKQMTIEEVSSKELSTLQNEIDLLKKLHHPNIVRYIGTEVSATHLSIFLEYVPGGSLKALLDKFGPLDEAVVKSYTRQLLLGLEYLHRHGIAHRDIKGANCLVGNDGVVKLADFGNSKQWRNTAAIPVTQRTSSQGDITGTPCWMAPEVIREKSGNINWKKADVWSLACTTLEIASGKPPWCQFPHAVTILFNIACQEDSFPQYPATASPELTSFLNTCLRRDIKQRPDATLLLLHPFVANMSFSLFNANGFGVNARPTTVNVAPTNPRSLWNSRRGSEIEDTLSMTPFQDVHLTFAPTSSVSVFDPIEAKSIHSTPNVPKSEPRQINRRYNNPSVKTDNLSIEIPKVENSNAKRGIAHRGKNSRIITDPEPEITTVNVSAENDDDTASVVSSVSDSTPNKEDEDDLFSAYEGEYDTSDNKQTVSSNASDPNTERESNTSGTVTPALSFPTLNQTFGKVKRSRKDMSQANRRHKPNEMEIINPPNEFNSENYDESSLPRIESDLAFLTPTSLKVEGDLMLPSFSFSPEKLSSLKSVPNLSKQISFAPSLGNTISANRKSPSNIQNENFTGLNEGNNKKGNKKGKTVVKSTSLPNLGVTSARIASPPEDYELDEFDNDCDDASMLQNAIPISLDEHRASITRLKSYRQLLVSSSLDGTVRIWGHNETESRAILDASTFVAATNEKRNERKITLGSRRETEVSTASTIKILNLWCESRLESIYAACSDTHIRVWSGVEGKPFRSLSGHEEAVSVIEGAENTSGFQATTLLATGSPDKTVRVWDVRAKRPQIFLFKGHSDTVTTLKWIEGGRSVVSAGKDKSIKIWDTRAGRLRVTIEKHFSAVSGLQSIPDFVGSPNGSIQPAFVSAGRDSMLYMWTANGDCIGNQSIHKGNIHFLSEVNSNLQYRQNSKTSAIISLGADNCIRMWDLVKNRCMSDVSNKLSSGGVFQRAIWIRSHHIVTASSQGVIKLWTYPTSSSTNDESRAISAGGPPTVITSAPPAQSAQTEWSSIDLACHSTAVTDLIANSHFVASSSKSGQIIRWNV